MLRAKQLDEALTAITESATFADQTGQHSYDAENRRLLAEIRLAMGDHEGTERAYLESLEIARNQGARWYTLRSSRGYASFLITVGRTEEARTILSVCDSITEGRDTYDFVYADALLKTI